MSVLRANGISVGANNTAPAQVTFFGLKTAIDPSPSDARQVADAVTVSRDSIGSCRTVGSQ